MRTLLCLGLAAGVLMLAGCTKDDIPPSPNGQMQGPAIPTVTFKGPNTTSTEANAALTKGYVSAANGTLAWMTVYTSLPSTGSANGNSWSWGYSAGGASYAFTATKGADATYTWGLTYNGTVGETTYANWIAYSGKTKTDGSSGSWKFFVRNTTTLETDFTYTTDASSVLRGTWRDYESNGVTVTTMRVIINNPDGSGEFQIFGNGTVMSYRSVWTPSGSGTWYSYTNGTQSGTGTWS